MVLLRRRRAFGNNGFQQQRKGNQSKKKIEKQFCIILRIRKISNDTAKRINEELYFKYILYSCKKIENEISIYCNSFSSKEFYEVE